MSRAASRFLLTRETEMDASAQTVKWYRQKFAQLEAVTGVSALPDLSRDVLLEFVGDLRKAGRSPHYVRGWYGVFRAFIGWAREEGFEVHPSLVREDSDRWFTIKKPIRTEVEIEVFNQEDLERIYEMAGTQPRNVVFCQVLAGTGVRISEALNLTIDDVQDDRLRVRQGKGRKPRWVPLSRNLQRELGRYIDRVRGDVETDRLFPNRSGQPWSRSSAEELMARIHKHTGLHVTAHVFRHTFATTYLQRGGSIARLRDILGHTSFAMVMRYVHFVGVDLNSEIDKLSAY